MQKIPKLPRVNKKRNSALLYEFLVNYATKSLVDQKPEEAKKSLALSKKYFSAGQPLHEELRLFREILNSGVKSRESAQKVISAICEMAKRTNSRDLDVAKSKIIKEINHTFNDPNFYNSKVSNYSIYNSIQFLLNEARNKKKMLDSLQKVKLEDTICEHIVVQQDSEVKPVQYKPEYTKAVYNLFVKKFNDKYKKSLTEGQKKFIVKYAKHLISPSKENFILEEISQIKKNLREVEDIEILKDKEMMKSLNECYRKISSLEAKTVDDDLVLEVLKYLKLVDEIKS